MDALYRLGEATANEIRDALADPPSNTAVRTLLTILLRKGHVVYRAEGIRYVYSPAIAKDQMARSVVAGVVENFFGGSIEGMVATLLSREESKLSDEQLDRLRDMIEAARSQGR